MLSALGSGIQAGNRMLILVTRGFKGLKQAIKLEFKLGRYSDVGGHLPKAFSYDYADVYLGCRALPRTTHLRQIGRHAKLFGKIDQ